MQYFLPILMLLSLCDKPTITQSNETTKTKNYRYPNQVGDIDFDKAIDNPEFKLCNEKMVLQDYQVGTQYIGERKKLIDHLMIKYNYKNHFEGNNNGYIIIRFVINCKGETGRFRVQELNQSLAKINFNPALVKQLLDQLKKANGWIPGAFKNTKCDSYDHIVFKIEDGKLKEIVF